MLVHFGKSQFSYIISSTIPAKTSVLICFVEINANDCLSRLSANMAVATLNVGTTGGAMGLAFWDCFAIIVVVNLLACLIPAWTAGFGLTGLRMTTFS